MRIRDARNAGHGLLVLGLLAAAACGLSVVGEERAPGSTTTASDDGGASVTPPGTSTATPDAGPAPSCLLADGGTTCRASASCENGACVDVASALAGFRQQVACGSSAGNYCNTDPMPADVTAKLGGTPGATYALALRIRGVVEQKTYTAETAYPATGTNAPFLVQGGTPANDNWNIVGMHVTTPDATWHLNSGDSGHDYADPLDYRTTITASAGASLVLSIDSTDRKMAKNRDRNDAPIVVDGIATYTGQFVQVDVVSVTRQ